MQVKVRTFKEGDEKTWVQIVNKSIAGSKRQPITIETVKQLKRDPYFDPKGVFFAFTDNEPVGICYVKAEPSLRLRKDTSARFA